MTTRLMITLSNDEAVALARLANEGLRGPREHLRYLLQEEARKRGLLSTPREREPGLDERARHRSETLPRG